MNDNLAMVNEYSRDFESWDVDEDSNKLTRIHVPNETKEFFNILQINKGNVWIEDQEIIDLSDSFSKLGLEEIKEVSIVRIDSDSDVAGLKSSEEDVVYDFLFVSNFHQSNARVRRSQLNSDLFRSNMWDKHARETPSVEILSKIMPQRVGWSHP